MAVCAAVAVLRPTPYPTPPAHPTCREAEKEASELLRQAGQARGLIDQAVAAAAAALQQVDALKRAEKEAAAEANEARAVIKQLGRR